MEFVLASASPRRQEILKSIDVSFIVDPADIDESEEPIHPINSYPVRLARKKAMKIAKKHPDAVVMGCDTIITIDDEIFGKPKDREDAFRILKKLSGRVHKVITGICLWRSDVITTFSVETKVTFFELTDDRINSYLDEGEWKDKAGAYSIQGNGGYLASEIVGDIYNVVGLPRRRLRKEIESFMNIS